MILSKKVCLCIAALGVTLALGVAGLSGCGSSSNPPSPTKTVFIKKANVICEKGRQEALNNPAANGPDGVIKGVLPAIQSAIAGVRALGAPSGDEQEVEMLLAGMQQAAAASKKQKVSTLPELEQIFRKTGEKARKYGITSCAYG